MSIIKATAIGLFRHSQEIPTLKEMMASYHAIAGVMQELHLQPTYFSADDGKGRGEYKKFGGAFHRRVLDGETQGYRSIGLAATPPESDSPAYDAMMEVSFGFSPEGQRISATLVVNEPYVICGSKACDALVNELARLWQWDYGFGFERDAATRPIGYLLGGDSNLQSAEDARRGQLWYACYQPEERRKRVRDIFPYNMVGPEHLLRRLPDGRSLQEFIEGDADSELRPLADNLWLWKVKADRIEDLREKLRGTGIIIAE